MMKIQSVVLISALLFAAQAQADTLVETPPIETPLDINGGKTTLASVSEPEFGEGSTPDGVSADQTFSEVANDDSLLVPLSAGDDNGNPNLSAGRGGRKILSGRKMLDNLYLTGNGVSAGEDGNGVTTTLAGNGQSAFFEGEPTDSHVQPHQDTTTVTADGQSITTGAGVDPDQIGGENNDALVYTVPGRK